MTWRRTPAPRTAAIGPGAPRARARGAFYQFLQWIAASPVEGRPRKRATASSLFGDLPCMATPTAQKLGEAAFVNGLRLTLSRVRPPDAFRLRRAGWGMPVYNWDTIGRRRLPWALRERCRAESADLFWRVTDSITWSASIGRTGAARRGEPYSSRARQSEPDLAR